MNLPSPRKPLGGTITAEDWRKGLALARERRKREKKRIAELVREKVSSANTTTSHA